MDIPEMHLNVSFSINVHYLSWFCSLSSLLESKTFFKKNPHIYYSWQCIIWNEGIWGISTLQDFNFLLMYQGSLSLIYFISSLSVLDHNHYIQGQNANLLGALCPKSKLLFGLWHQLINRIFFFQPPIDRYDNYPVGDCFCKSEMDKNLILLK